MRLLLLILIIVLFVCAIFSFTLHCPTLGAFCMFLLMTSVALLYFEKGGDS